MVKFAEERLYGIFNNFNKKRIAVVGDLMLDCYICGNVNRISPEAPVPVIEVNNEFYRFGGAANVGLNINSLGAVPVLFGLIGNDREGEVFKTLMNDNNFVNDGIVESPDRPTTVKTRIMAHSQHVVRIDKEVKTPISEKLEEKFINALNDQKNDLDAIILQDYNKGVLNSHFIKRVIEFAHKNHIMITVDPKFNCFFEYNRVNLFKPNRKESEDALNYKFDTDEKFIEAGKEIRKRLKAEYVLITRSEKGMTLFSENDPYSIPTRARKVADVSGAGDTVIATITTAMTAGADIREAATIANHAGGLVCEETGIVPVNKDNLLLNLLQN